MSGLRIGIVDTGVNPWHSHVRGTVAGCRIYAGSDDAIAAACEAAIAAGCVIVASARPDCPGWLPASLPGVHAVTADEALADDEVRALGGCRLAAAGRPRDLAARPREANFSGHSFACARGLVHLARQRRAAVSRSS